VSRADFPGCEAADAGMDERKNYIPPAVVLMLILLFLLAVVAVVPYAGI
jgi:hypothetical protein